MRDWLMAKAQYHSRGFGVRELERWPEAAQGDSGIVEVGERPRAGEMETHNVQRTGFPFRNRPEMLDYLQETVGNAHCQPMQTYDGTSKPR